MQIYDLFDKSKAHFKNEINIIQIEWIMMS